MTTALDGRKPSPARPGLSDELDTPRSRHNAAVILGRKIDSYRRMVFGDRLEGGLPFRVSGGSLMFRKDSSHRNHLKLYCVRQISFPTDRVEIVAES